MKFWLLLPALLAAASAHAVEFSQVQIDGKRVTVCKVDPRREHLQLFLRDAAGRPYEHFAPLAAALQRQGQTLPFAMNAGMFHADLGPVGLYLAAGRTIAPLNTAPGTGNFFLKPNGVFCVSTLGTARVVESSEFPALTDAMQLATQSGPLLVRGGKIHPGFHATSSSRLRRNGVGVTAEGQAIFVITEDPLNFYEFAVCFRDALHCPDALFLDGTVSSLYAPVLDRDDAATALGPIIGVTQPRP